MNHQRRRPDPVNKYLDDVILDSPPGQLPLASAPEQQITIIPISDDDPLAGIIDSAARQTREDDGRES